MTNEANGPNEDARRRIDAHLDAIDEALIACGMSRSERRSITDDVEAQIVEMLSSRAGPSPGLADVEAVLAELDPPEAYAGESAREGTMPPPPPPTPAPFAKSARPHFSRTAILGAVWAGLFFVVLFLASSMYLTLAPTRDASREEPASDRTFALAPVQTESDQGTISQPAPSETADDEAVVAATDADADAPELAPEPEPLGSVVPADEPMGRSTSISFFGLFIILPAIPILAAPIGTTILGLVAVSQIRRSAGRLYGLGLALFDAILFPLLLLDIGIWGLLHYVLESVTSANTATILAVAVLACLIVDFLLIRWAWRSVNRPHPSAAARIACPR